MIEWGNSSGQEEKVQEVDSCPVLFWVYAHKNCMSSEEATILKLVKHGLFYGS